MNKLYKKQKDNKLVGQSTVVVEYDIHSWDDNLVFNVQKGISEPTNDKDKLIAQKENLFLHEAATKGQELVSVKHLSKKKRQYYFKRVFFPDSD